MYHCMDYIGRDIKNYSVLKAGDPGHSATCCSIEFRGGRSGKMERDVWSQVLGDVSSCKVHNKEWCYDHKICCSVPMYLQH